MRDLIDIVTEAVIPPTQYGYWISQYAEIYPVGNHGHENFIKSVEGHDSGEAMKRGWVRIVTVNGDMEAEACFPVVKPRVKARLVAVARSEDFREYIVDNHDGRGDYTEHRYSDILAFVHGIDDLAHAGVPELVEVRRPKE